jgi:hypothetical protein
MTLADIREKKTPIVIGDKTYNLFYDLNAFAELEEIYGSVEKMFSNLADGSIKAILTVFWVGLLHENEAITKKEVGKLFHVSEIKEVTDILYTALTSSIKQDKEEKNAQSPTQ